MAELDRTAEDSDISNEEHERPLERSRAGLKIWLKRLVTFVSFGPGVLGILWLIGRILRR